MKITKFLGLTICISLLASIFLGCFAQPVKALTDNMNKQAVTGLSQQQTDEKILLSTKYPVLSGIATTQFTFDVELAYRGGTEPRYFDVALNGPDVFFYTLRQSYGGESDIASIKLDPLRSDTLRVTASPNILNLPDPGEYTITLETSSGDLHQSIDLKVIVTAKYSLIIDTTVGLLSTKITADKDNFFTINVTNTGTATIEKINLTTDVRGTPEDWQVIVDPVEINSLAAGVTKEVQLNIKPPSNTISGDYEIKVWARSEAGTAADEVAIRVTVLTQTIWGWVGVGIIVIVVAGLIAMFMFLGRR